MKIKSSYKVGVFTFFTLFLFAFQGENMYSQESGSPEVIDVKAIYDPANNQHLFKTTTDTISSGWNTFHFTNMSPAVHFMIIEHQPGDKNTKDVEKEVGPIFTEAMNLFMKGDKQAGYAKLGEFPAWFSQVKFMGGTGLVMPGHETTTTTFLTPGNYTLECYIKTPEGKFHSSLGMFRDLYVTPGRNNVQEPSNADIEIYPSKKGYKIEGNLRPGKHSVAVHFTEPIENMSGLDVHIIKVNKNTDMDKITKWMDWTEPQGFVSDMKGEHPAPAEFLGGSQEAPEGSTTYFTIDLKPGKYAVVAEQAASNPTYKFFTVSE
ncbi:MAG: hypothetical protein WCD31_05285 [Gillisia sp.]